MQRSVALCAVATAGFALLGGGVAHAAPGAQPVDAPIYGSAQPFADAWIKTFSDLWDAIPHPPATPGDPVNEEPYFSCLEVHQDGLRSIKRYDDRWSTFLTDEDGDGDYCEYFEDEPPTDDF